MLAMRANAWRKKEVFSAWLLVARRIRLSRRFTHISHLQYCSSRERMSLRKLFKNMRNMKKIKRCYTSDDEKNIRAGLGHLRIWFTKVWVRKAFLTWESYYMLQKNLELAKRWNEKRVIKRVFRGFNGYAMSEIKSRRAIRSASIQQRMIAQYIRDIDSSSDKNTDVDARGTSLAKQKRAQQYDEARRRKSNLQKELDADILSQQRAQRRQRVESERREREEKFKLNWAKKKSEVESACLEQCKSWMLSSDFKNQSQKKQREVQQYLSITQASAMNTDRENSITSLAAINYSILDAKMAHAGIVPDDLFRSLEKMKSPINAVPFQSALVSCGLILDPSEFESIFNGLAQYKKSKEVSVDFSDLHVLRRLADTYIGQEGTRWKLYVSPIHQQQLLHNIFTGKKIFEKNVKKKNIRQMVSENLQDYELLKARRKHSEKQRQAHRTMIEHHAAMSIQSMYFQWRGRQRIQKRLWIIERKKMFQTRAKQAGAAMLIQRYFRSRRGSGYDKA
mmetsp:Transcript_33988/g.71502  ORF Transcript_33988/g.71502 Transcript_33988/m.71502 type:complete len:507 (-) Transcript_33988:509-2029(-)